MRGPPARPWPVPGRMRPRGAPAPAVGCSGARRVGTSARVEARATGTGSVAGCGRARSAAPPEDSPARVGRACPTSPRGRPRRSSRSPECAAARMGPADRVGVAPGPTVAFARCAVRPRGAEVRKSPGEPEGRTERCTVSAARRRLGAAVAPRLPAAAPVVGGRRVPEGLGGPEGRKARGMAGDLGEPGVRKAPEGRAGGEGR